MIGPGSRLRLSRKARLRVDPVSGKQVLLYPERGLELSATAARIATLCEEGTTAGGIVDRLAADFPRDPRARIEAEVMAFLRDLEERGLLEVREP